MEEFEVVRDFSNVFPNELPDLAPKREIDFTIELSHNTSLISKAPYQMAPAKLKELKEQLQDLDKVSFVPIPHHGVLQFCS